MSETAKNSADLPEVETDAPAAAQTIAGPPQRFFSGGSVKEGWGVFMALMLGSALFSTILPSERLPTLTCELMFGIVIAHCMLAGVWLALGPGWLLVRLGVVPLWILAAAGLGGAFSRPLEAIGIMLMCGAATALAVAGVVALARLLVGVRLVHQSDEGPAKPFQYRLKHLLILMALTSVVLAIGRGLTMVALGDWMFR